VNKHQQLPDLSERLAAELAGLLGRVAEPCQGQLKSLLAWFAHSELANFTLGLAAWLTDDAPGETVKRYTLLRQLISLAVQIYAEKEP
jgi:hypothetical protein